MYMIRRIISVFVAFVMIISLAAISEYGARTEHLQTAVLHIQEIMMQSFRRNAMLYSGVFRNFREDGILNLKIQVRLHLTSVTTHETCRLRIHRHLLRLAYKNFLKFRYNAQPTINTIE